MEVCGHEPWPHAVCFSFGPWKTRQWYVLFLLFFFRDLRVVNFSQSDLSHALIALRLSCCGRRVGSNQPWPYPERRITESDLGKMTGCIWHSVGGISLLDRWHLAGFVVLSPSSSPHFAGASTLCQCWGRPTIQQRASARSGEWDEFCGPGAQRWISGGPSMHVEKKKVHCDCDGHRWLGIPTDPSPNSCMCAASLPRQTGENDASSLWAMQSGKAGESQPPSMTRQNPPPAAGSPSRMTRLFCVDRGDGPRRKPVPLPVQAKKRKKDGASPAWGRGRFLLIH